MLRNAKAAPVWQLTFSIILFSILIASCDDPGSVGSGFVDESKVRIDTIPLTSLPFDFVDPYTGQLTLSPIGAFSDPIFGDIYSQAIFKPSILEGDESFIFSNSADLTMRLNIDTTGGRFFGTSGSDLSFTLYRVDEIWRGASYKLGDEVEIETDDGSPFFSEVGSFNYADVDTSGFVEFELDGIWKNDFIRFYTDSTDMRDSTYQFSDFGLAIIPDEGADRLVYARFGTSRLLMTEPLQGEDTTSHFMLDWAYDMEITGGNSPTGNFTLSNTYEQIIRYNLNTIADDFDSKNFVRAEIAFTADTVSMQNSLTSDQIRTEEPPFKVQLGPSIDLAYDIGFNESSAFATYDAGVYRFDITELFNAYFFGDTNLEEVYFYADQNDGRLGFTSFYGLNADSRNVPNLLIFTLEEE